MLQTQVTEHLASIVGAEHVLALEDDRRFYSTDVYRMTALAGVVVRPNSAEQVQGVVRLANAQKLGVSVRGGGASYTDAYSPNTPNSILIDTSRFSKIVEINEADMFVTVEPGVTWDQLDQALKPKGLRTPFWGPFSGVAATIGGSVSQHSLSHGTAAHGISADSVIGMDVVVGDGDLIQTGSAARLDMASPFYRYSGPDIVGLFAGDAGALGVKTAITLRLIRRRPSVSCESFSFETFSQLQHALSEVSRAGLADENFALDPTLQDGQIARQDANAMLGTAWRVFRSSPNPFVGAATLAKMAAAGRSFLEKGAYSAHFIVDGVNEAETRAKSAALREICMAHGVVVANTFPTVVTAMPFAPLSNVVLGPAGERWVPIHGVLPHSQADAFHKDLRALFDAEASNLERFKAKVGGMFSTISTNAFLYEIAFYWEDERNFYHEKSLPEDHLAALPDYEASPEGRAYIDALKDKCVDLYGTYGAIHFQLGKAYPFMSTRKPEVGALLSSLKRELDPNGVFNPGALELNSQA